MHHAIFVAMIDRHKRVTDVLPRFILILHARSDKLIKQRALVKIIFYKIEPLITLVVAMELDDIIVLYLE